MRNTKHLISMLIVFMCATAARAGETPLYQGPPEWVAPEAIPQGMLDDAAPGPAYDWQTRIEDGLVWGYFDIAVKIASPEMLSQNSTLSLPWFPDKGDLIIHEVSIVRGRHTIDLLSGGRRFEVLRREQELERRKVTGVLTATLEPEGLQVGDIVRVRASVTTRDGALAGKAQWTPPLLASPGKVSSAKMRFSYPAASSTRWKVLATGVATASAKQGKYTHVELSLPAPEPPEMPEDAPMRFRHPPLLDTSDFATWAEVSSTMAALFSTADDIDPAGPLAEEIAAIAKATSDPELRAAMALRSVQDKIRYLAVEMNGGNYVPQSPEHTWSVRYGDCKAKSLLLLAMLRALDIEAEAVLASATFDDLVPQRLPSVAAFNHVLVRAHLSDRWLWLDGTTTGTRLADIRDTPPFRHVLPLRPGGSGLETITPGAPARPTVNLTIEADESASVDLPSVIAFRAEFRGPAAAMLNGVTAQLDAKQKREFLTGVAQALTGEGQYVDLETTTNAESGVTTLAGTGVVTTPWKTEDRIQKRAISRIPDEFAFFPDRARPAWTEVPVVTGNPDRMHSLVRIRLPEAGRGITIEGDRSLDEDVAGSRLSRNLTLADGVATIDETIANSGAEVAADAVASERDRVALINARAPLLIAPADARRRWEMTAAELAGSSQARAIDAVYEKAIAAAAPDDILPFSNRASYRAGIGDRKGALQDLRKVIAVSPSIDAYLRRADILAETGDLPSALAEAREARKLDPSATGAIWKVAYLTAKLGRLDEAITLLDERIALGGDSRFDLREYKALILGEFGESARAIAEWDELIAVKPGNPDLLNGRCWARALGKVQLDSALKDCTKAIELSTDSAQALDSRAVVWLRLGRFEEALQDIDAALAQSPALGPSRFVRSLVLRQLERGPEADEERALALHLSPTVERDYARYDLTH